LAEEHQLSRTVFQPQTFSPVPVQRREPRAVPPEPPKRKSHDWVPESMVAGDAVAPASPFETLSTRDSNTPPSVQVTIGRVEVRAVMPPTQTPRLVERKAPPLFSLEEYLRERNGRRR